MHFLLQSGEDHNTIVSEEMTDDAGRRQYILINHDILQAHATDSGMVVVFIGDLKEHMREGIHEWVTHFAEAADALPVGEFEGHVREGLNQWVQHIAHATDALFTTELTQLADNYRRLIRESLPSGKNLAVKTALNRVRVQERILAELDLADQSQACELLRLSKSNPSATLKRIEERGGLVRIDRDNRPFYPLFQFDVENGRIHPVITEINRMRPESWSNMRLCYWMTRKHADFGRAPAELLGQADDEILVAFHRATLPEVHG